MHAQLVALIFRVWVAFNPTLANYQGGPEIADAIATAVIEDGKNAPVYGSHDEDAALMAWWALKESWLRRNAQGDGGRSIGPWQLRLVLAYHKPVVDQARTWLRLLHLGKGKTMCPEAPAAVMWGAGGGFGCRLAIPGRPGWDTTMAAEDRIEHARKYLQMALASESDVGVAEPQKPLLVDSQRE